jgi:hypothetical protein
MKPNAPAASVKLPLSCLHKPTSLQFMQISFDRSKTLLQQIVCASLCQGAQVMLLSPAARRIAPWPQKGGQRRGHSSPVMH